MAKSTKLIELPQVIETGVEPLKVDWVPSLTHGNGPSYARFSSSLGVIQMSRELHKNDVTVMNTLIHELIHSIFYNYHLPSEHEEQIVSCVTNGLCTILRLNPDLVNYIQKVSKQ